MNRPVKLTTGFPSALKAAKRLGVTQKEAKKLALFAEASRQSGGFQLSRAGRLLLVNSKSRKNNGLTASEAITRFTRSVARSKASKGARADAPSPKK